MFRIRELAITERQADAIWVKHQVTTEEAYDVCEAARLVLRGRDGSFAIYGQTSAGRYLVLFVHPRGHETYVLATARDLTDSERWRIRQLPMRNLYDDDEG